MYTWTRKEIAEAFDVSPATPHYWIHNWGPETDHPFPAPVATMQTKNKSNAGWTRKVMVYDPGTVQVWFSGLSAAKTRRMSKALTGIPRPRKRPPVWGDPDLDKSIIELEESMALLMETVKEMEALQEVIRRG